MIKKILFNSNSDYNLYLFRQGIMKRMMNEGWEVHAVCPVTNYEEELKKNGIIVHHIKLSRHGLNPFQDLIYLISLYRFFKKIRPNVIHSFTIKPNIYGNIATIFVRIPKIINSVTGLGYVYIDGGIRKLAIRVFVNLLYRCAFLLSNKVIFQNQDDQIVFTGIYKILPLRKTTLIKSSGVDTEFFSNCTVNWDAVNVLKRVHAIPDGVIIVTMIARMIWEKGVREFVETANIMKKSNIKIFFLLVGPLEIGSPSAVPEKFLIDNNHAVKWIGHQKDIKNIIALSSIVTLPSYREGIPKILLEAMAMSKPIITTNAVGCRELIDNKKNGLLVQIKNVDELVCAVSYFIENPKHIQIMGENGRKNIEKSWGESRIISQQINEYS